MKPYIKEVLISSTLFLCVLCDVNRGMTSEVKFTKQEEEDEDAMILDCKAYGYPQSVTITREQNEGFLSKWVGDERRYSKTLRHHFVDGGCELMASYKCSVLYSDGNVISKVLDYKKSNCPPKFCPKNNLSQHIQIDMESKASFNICVIAYPNITVCEYRPSKSKMCSQEKHIKITTDNDESVIYFNILFEIQKVNDADLGKYILEIVTVPTSKLIHPFSIVKPEEHFGDYNLDVMTTVSTSSNFIFSITKNVAEEMHLTDNQDEIQYIIDENKLSPFSIVILPLFLTLVVGILCARCLVKGKYLNEIIRFFPTQE